MAYNFKSIADVEVVAEPVESANVLIEENGVIKRAPKDAIGGADGFGKYWVMLNTHNWSVTASEGIYEALENFLANCVPTSVDTFLYRYEDDGVQIEISYPSYIRYYDGEHDIIEVHDNIGIRYYIHKDGNHDHYWD